MELVDANMGETIQAIARKAGFTVEGDSSTLSKKLTTRFNDFDIDRGIMRLFSLAKETNYLISYDTKGEVSKLEIYGAAVSSVRKTPPAAPGSPAASRQVTPSASSLLQPARHNQTTAAPASGPPVVLPQPQPPLGTNTTCPNRHNLLRLRLLKRHPGTCRKIRTPEMTVPRGNRQGNPLCAASEKACLHPSYKALRENAVVFIMPSVGGPCASVRWNVV